MPAVCFMCLAVSGFRFFIAAVEIPVSRDFVISVKKARRRKKAKKFTSKINKLLKKTKKVKKII